MEEFLANLHLTTVSGLDFVPSLEHLFLILCFILCTGLMMSVGVLLKWANPCLYFGLFCAYLSMKNLLPIFTGDAMWIPLLMLPGCLGGCALYLVIAFVLWLVDAESGGMSDTAKMILAWITVIGGAIALGLFLYIMVTHNMLIIILICGSAGVLGMLNQRKIIANSHRFKTYNDLYDIQIDEYTMKVQKDVDAMFSATGSAVPEKKAAAAAGGKPEKKRRGLLRFLPGGKRGGKDA